MEVRVKTFLSGNVKILAYEDPKEFKYRNSQPFDLFNIYASVLVFYYKDMVDLICLYMYRSMFSKSLDMCTTKLIVIGYDENANS